MSEHGFPCFFGKLARMQRDEVLARLRANGDRLVALGARHLYLYGSVARGEASPDSDVDLLVDPVDETFTIFSLATLKERCGEILGVEADVHDYGGYERLPAFRDRVGNDLIRVF